MARRHLDRQQSFGFVSRADAVNDGEARVQLRGIDALAPRGERIAERMESEIGEIIRGRPEGIEKLVLPGAPIIVARIDYERAAF